MIRAVFFDANGVLYVRPNLNARLRELLDGFGLQWPGSENLWQETTREHHLAMLGEIPRDDLYDARLRACGITDDERLEAGRRVMAEDDADIVIVDGVAETLHRMKATGLTLSIITNSASPSPEKRSWLNSQGLDVEWDVIVNSCEVGVAKPSIEIYEIAMREIQISPPESVFVGHTPAEIEGAKAAGMRTVMLDDVPSSQADFAIEHLPELLENPRILG